MVFRFLNRPIGKQGKKKPKTKQLWEREFNIVDGGLDEGQVVAFVNDLIARYEASPEAKAPMASAGPILETTALDTQQTVASIKAKANMEAEAERARIIERARLEADEIKKKAVTAAQKEIEDIVTAAKRKAEIVEVEARQKAWLFLLRAREKIEEEVKGEYKKAYSRLLSSLHSVVTEGEDIEAEWRSKTVRLSEIKNVELEEAETALLGSAAEAVSYAGTAIPENEVKPTEASQDNPEPPVQFHPEVTISKPVEAAVDTVEHSHEEKPAEEAGFVPSKREEEALYTGEIELNVVTPINPKMVTSLTNYLQTVSEVKILHSRGSWERGTTITLMLEKPVPLISLISKIEGIAVTLETPAKDNGKRKGGLLVRQRGNAQRIKLTLRGK